MPSLPVRRDRPESDDGEENETSNPTPPSSSKRRRIDEGTQGGGNDAPESPQPSQANGGREIDSLNATSTQSGNSNTPGPDGFKPGAIVRIKLTDFVTYTSAEFFLGPKLNMVIGPNGTGKSTLVCAICLGLGWGPQVWFVESGESSFADIRSF